MPTKYVFNYVIRPPSTTDGNIPIWTEDDTGKVRDGITAESIGNPGEFHGIWFNELDAASNYTPIALPSVYNFVVKDDHLTSFHMQEAGVCSVARLLPTPGTAFFFACWLRVDNMANGCGIALRNAAGTSIASVSLNVATGTVFYINNAGVLTDTTVPYTVGWHHLIMDYGIQTAGKQSIWMDGVQILTSVNCQVGITMNSALFGATNEAWYDAFFIGTNKEVAWQTYGADFSNVVTDEDDETMTVSAPLTTSQPFSVIAASPPTLAITAATAVTNGYMTSAGYLRNERYLIMGFEDQTTSQIGMNLGGAGANIFVLDGTPGHTFYVWYSGTRYTVTGPILKDMTASATGSYWLYYASGADILAGTITAAAAPAAFNTCITIAQVYKNAAGSYLVANERHMIDWMPNHRSQMHQAVGALIDIGNFTCTVNASCQLIMAANADLWDEDLEFTIPSKAAATASLRLFYRTAPGVWTWDAPAATVWKLNGASIRWDNAGVLANVPNTDYINYYVFATNIGTGTAGELGAIMGQQYFTSLINARAGNLSGINLTGLCYTEFKVLYKVTMHMTAPGVATYDEITDLRTTGALGNTQVGAFSSASSITYVPFGTVSSTNVQGALQELTNEKAPAQLPFTWDGDHEDVGEFLMDTGTDEFLQLSTVIPATMDVTNLKTVVKFSCYWDATVAGDSTFAWDLQSNAAGANITTWDSTDTHITVAAANQNIIFTLSYTLAAATFAVGDLFRFKLHRHADASARTLHITTALIQLEL